MNVKQLELHKRRMEIYNFRQNSTLAKTGVNFDITPERVRQICAKVEEWKRWKN